MSGLVSFCVFGDDPANIYYGGALENARLYRQWRPDWTLLFYMGTSVPKWLWRDLEAENPNCRFVLNEATENQTATYWRFLAVKQFPDADFILFRDVDSRPSDREKAAVTEWVCQNDYPYHMMRDHPYHGRHLMSGMWAIKKQAYHQIQNTLPDEIYDDYYQTDQIELEFKVWPYCRRQIMVHIGCYQIFERLPQRRPFTVARKPGEFVGQGYYADGKIRYPGHEDLVIPDAELMAVEPRFFEDRFYV